MLLRPVLTAVALASLPAAARAADACREDEDARIWISPAAPVAGQPLRIMVVSERAREGELTIFAGGKPAALAAVRRGGPPFSLAAETTAGAGVHRIELRAGGKTITCLTITAGRRPARRPARPKVAPAWATTRAWDRATEGFYSAWIEALFDAPPEESLSLPSLAPALRDPKRNFLWGHLGLREDDPKNKAIPPAEPDCADLPYYLRAYFSWKLGLPFLFRDCDRGARDRPPRCGEPQGNDQPIEARDELTAFRKLLRQLANEVHSGSARTALGEEASDYYPVPLAREHLRPGVVYADPYGHVLMVVKWQPQEDKAGGRLFAVDGQPDNSIGRKRFWEGTFLFASDVKSAGAGFKAFRPVLRKEDGRAALLDNQTLAKDPRFPPHSMEQAGLTPEAFYARMARLVNPRGLDAVAAYEETLAALVEQLETRVGSVDNGEKYMRDNGNPVVPMPEGPKIFETVGPWEDYATPSRDMRLIIAMNVLTALPDRLTRHPELFVLGGRKPAEAAEELRRLHERRVRERSIEYRRSDGSPFRLTVADVLARKSAFEIAYNPNDCVEVRWGASEGTPDFSTCKRRAPADQQARMAEHRAWFREARRPSR